MFRSVKAFAPATVANVACGYDILGFAVNAPGDEVTAKKTKAKGVRIAGVTGQAKGIPKSPKKNVAGAVVAQLLDQVCPDFGVSLSIKKGIPPGSGLGSSAASSAAALAAVNTLLGSPLTPRELVPFAMEGEKLASGTAHADNVAPALLGGFVLIRSYEPLDIITLSAPAKLYCAAVHPKMTIKTSEARAILKNRVPLSEAIAQWGNNAALIAGLLKEDYELIGRSLEDRVIEPVRSLLIPGFDEVKDATLNAGALGCSISGSGPTLFALCTSKAKGEKIGKAMQKAFRAQNLASSVYVSPVNKSGTKILAKS